MHLYVELHIDINNIKYLKLHIYFQHYYICIKYYLKKYKYHKKIFRIRYRKTACNLFQDNKSITRYFSIIIIIENNFPEVFHWGVVTLAASRTPRAWDRHRSCSLLLAHAHASRFLWVTSASPVLPVAHCHIYVYAGQDGGDRDEV